jgi:hypothetical protein
MTSYLHVLFIHKTQIAMKNLLLFGLLMTASIQYGVAQIDCIQCFSRNDAISPNAPNRLLNGGFEQHNCDPAWLAGSFCPSSNLYNCDIESWRCIGGGTASYPVIFDSTLSLIPEGEFAAYFGNGNAFVCADLSFDTSCIVRQECSVTGFPTGFPTTLDGYGGPDGVSLEQTVDGFIVDEAYVLEFWAGGEPLQGLLQAPGVFAVDVGFGKSYLTCLPTGEGAYPTGTVYLIHFRAASPTHTITFTNWGHMCGECTEVVIDNVRLYALSELSPPFDDCTTSTNNNTDLDNSILIQNPVGDEIQLNMSCNVRLIDTNGRVILAQTGGTRIDVSWLKSGIYYLVAEGENGHTVRKVLKM